MSNITVGHDAELFLQDGKGGFVPAIGLVGGTKEKPFKVDQGAFQEDNVMAELNVDPATTREEFSDRTKYVMDQLRKHIRPHGLSLSKESAAEFTTEQLDDPQANMFGCLPDYDAWDICENPLIDLSGQNKRYAGGHIHIGVPFTNDGMAICRFVQRLDMTIGIGMQLLFGESERSKTYGRWGAHRPTAYGVEYRVPDNSWLFKPSYRRWVFDVVEEMALQSDRPPQYTLRNLTDVNKLNSGDKRENLRHFYTHTTRIKLPKVV